MSLKNEQNLKSIIGIFKSREGQVDKGQDHKKICAGRGLFGGMVCKKTLLKAAEKITISVYKSGIIQGGNTNGQKNKTTRQRSLS